MYIIMLTKEDLVNKRSALRAGATVLAFSMLGFVAPQALADDVAKFDVNATANTYTLTDSGFDTVSGDKVNGTLVCVPGKASYSIGYQGLLDMTEVKAEWEAKKKLAIESALTLAKSTSLGKAFAYKRMLGYDTDEALVKDMIFDPLSVSSDFTISFRIVDPSLVTVNTSMVDTADKLAKTYQADNAGDNATFASYMIPTSGFTYNAGTGVLSASFKLKDGLTAGELDDAYAKMTDPAKNPLVFNTPVGMITVSSDVYKNHLDELEHEGVIATLKEDTPKVEGNFDVTATTIKIPSLAETYLRATGRNVDELIEKALPQINATIDKYFPMTFGQNKPGVNVSTEIKTLTSATHLYSFTGVDADGKQKELPAEVTALLPEGMGKLTVDEATVATTSTFDDVKVADGTWHFEGWNVGKIEWNDDKDVALDCKKVMSEGKWIFTAAPVDPVAPIAPANSANPATPVAKKLAKTGADTTVLAGLSAALLAAGAFVAGRRRK